MASLNRDRPGANIAVDSTRSRSGKPNEVELASCDDLDIRIARDGTWYYLNSPIGRQPLVKLFASVLRREDDGDYYLITPVERCRIQVEDAPFVAVAVAVEGAGRDQVLTFRTNLEDEVVAGPAHPIRVALNTATGEPTPYIHIRARLEALIARSVYYELVDRGVEAFGDNKRVLAIWSDGIPFTLGELDDES
ncbi:MAG: DUF1285 domain-containing protein [Alphaproteobacteria bacterium]|nr:DUF1285 domain-containing protein [Alphaproteobacteria bacterium]